MLLPAPRTSRDLLEAFRVYDPSQGIGKFLQKIDYASMSARQAMFCALGRLPPANALLVPQDYHPRRHLRSLLLGEAFQKSLMEFVLESYPEKRRWFFVHVPKCAGSDLTSLLTKSNPSFNFRLVDRTWVSSEAMLAAIKVLVEELAYSDRVFVHGHVALRQYLAEDLIRFGDSVFTIVRDPQEMVISRLNYMLTRFIDDPEMTRQDTREWARKLKPDTIRKAVAAEDYRDAALEMLFAPGLVPVNPACQFLGDGTAKVAFELCARADVEITHVEMYEPWLRLRWGIAVSPRMNASRQIVSMDMLGDAARKRAEELTLEDRVFVDRVKRAMKEENKCFVMAEKLYI